MPPEIKFCGLTREEDAALASALGAAYVGAIFAGGPRNLSPERAAAVLGAASTGVKRVGVFGHADAPTIAAIAKTAGLDVVQLHGDPGESELDRVRAASRGEIWAVLRVSGAQLPDGAERMFTLADAVVLDARVEGRLGGTGVRLNWSALSPEIERVRASARGGVRGSVRVVLAGGLTADNVGEAIAAIHPDVVDVSSGVESAPGVKDHHRMRAFAKAVGR